MKTTAPQRRLLEDSALDMPSSPAGSPVQVSGGVTPPGAPTHISGGAVTPPGGVTPSKKSRKEKGILSSIVDKLEDEPEEPIS